MTSLVITSGEGLQELPDSFGMHAGRRQLEKVKPALEIVENDGLNQHDRKENEEIAYIRR